MLFHCVLAWTAGPWFVPSSSSLGSSHCSEGFCSLKRGRGMEIPPGVCPKLLVFCAVCIPPLFCSLHQTESNHPVWNVSRAKAPCKLQREMTNFMGWLWSNGRFHSLSCINRKGKQTQMKSSQLLEIIPGWLVDEFKQWDRQNEGQSACNPWF